MINFVLIPLSPPLFRRGKAKEFVSQASSLLCSLLLSMLSLSEPLLEVPSDGSKVIIHAPTIVVNFFFRGISPA